MPNVNVQYLLAGTLLDGGFTIRMSIDDERLHDGQIRSLMAKITLATDASFGSTRAARVTVVRQTIAGEERLERTIYDVRGTPAHPMTDDEVRDKGGGSHDRCDWRRRNGCASDLIAAVETIANLDGLMSLFGRGR